MCAILLIAHFMERDQSTTPSKFTSTMTLTKVPKTHILPISQRPEYNIASPPCSTTLPVIDLSGLHHASHRSRIVDEVHAACKTIGFFQVINHGIATTTITDAVECAEKFFNLPIEEKMTMVSDDIHKPVRYGASLNRNMDEVQCWRDFIKHYSHPISSWIHLWPSSPSCYREKMGKYAKEVQSLHKQLMELVFESLGLNPNYLRDEIEQGSQVMTVNCYPSCPQPELTLGMLPHSDYSALTILHQSCIGLQVLDRENKWVSVPMVKDGLIVQLGDQMEVMSNGLYKSVVHRATLSSVNKRFSIASLHGLGMQKKAKPMPELVNEEHPLSYHEFSLCDFLDFISSNDITKGRYIDTLKKHT